MPVNSTQRNFIPEDLKSRKPKFGMFPVNNNNSELVTDKTVYDGL